MMKTNAEYQREHRKRRAGRIAALEADNARLAAELGSLRAQNEGLAADCERLRASASACRHPVEMVDNGTCRGCGTDVY
jgi:hypothetical protein